MEEGEAAAHSSTPRGVPVATIGTRGMGGLLTPVPEAPLSPVKSKEQHWQEVAITSMCYCRDTRNLAACVGALGRLSRLLLTPRCFFPACVRVRL